MDWQPRRLQRWLSERLEGEGQIVITPVERMTSNENYLLDWGVHRWLLRKMPAILSSQSAHNVLREYRVLKALEQTPVRSAQTVITCSDSSVIGCPFYIMERISGVVIDRLLPASYGISGDCIDVLALDVINVLTALHQVDWHELGLSDIGRPEPSLSQQVRRWLAQHQVQRNGAFPAIERLSDWLNAHCPVGQKAVLIHGDYQLDNMMVSSQPPARLLAVIDWELATLGDPLMDLASLLLSWPAPGNSYANSLLASGRPLRGTASFIQLAQRYAKATGCDISDLSYYLVLSAWKRAVILESRYVSLLCNKACAGSDPQSLEFLSARIALLLEQAESYINHPVRF